MCNIAGYVGDRPAAPILIEMLRKQEGLDCGYFTGIATMHEGKIYYAKLTGDLDRLLEKTDAASFPGTIGIIHGRTPGHPEEGDSWAHPFVYEEEGVVQNAMVMNGTHGSFGVRKEAYAAYAKSVQDKGYKWDSLITGDKSGLYLGEHICVHASEVLSYVVSEHIMKGEPTVTALANAFYEMPIECVGLLLSLTEPEAISWCQMNFPMHVGFADHGAYLATAPQAFPEDAGEPIHLPPLSSGLVKKNEFTCQRFKRIPGSVSPVTYQIHAKAYEEMCQELKEGDKTIDAFTEMGINWFEPGDCKFAQMRVVVYGILNDLYRQGKLKIEKKYVPGMADGLMAPELHMTYAE